MVPFVGDSALFAIEQPLQFDRWGHQVAYVSGGDTEWIPRGALFPANPINYGLDPATKLRCHVRTPRLDE
jgi:hypothetical protein